MTTGPLRQLAGLAAASPLFAGARRCWDANQQNWNLPLSKSQKLLVGGYLILQDYHDGVFPRRTLAREEVYGGELNYHETLPGVSPDKVAAAELRKPWWFGPSVRKYLGDLRSLIAAFERCGVAPPQKVLELGAGGGWMAEALALMGFEVVSTTINPRDTELARRRVAGIAAKGLACQLSFRTAPMETVGDAVRGDGPFDAVFVFEALHHSFDWREALTAAHGCLKPGGWLFVMNEPSLIHTLVAYRVARLSHTHEIGFRPRQVLRHLRQLGCARACYLQNRWHFYVRPFSLAARKPDELAATEPSPADRVTPATGATS